MVIVSEIVFELYFLPLVEMEKIRKKWQWGKDWKKAAEKEFTNNKLRKLSKNIKTNPEILKNFEDTTKEK